jgi:hypothetical protein
MAKINGLFLNYSGTISPLNATRELSRVPPDLEAVLYNIRKYIPIGIISAKDLHFILPRTPFASAWSAIDGLELKIGSELFISKGVGDVLTFLNQSLRYAKSNLKEGGVIEEKCSYTGEPMAFCVDWRQMPNETEAREMAVKIANYCRNFPLTIVEYQNKPYFDVFPCVIDKRKALQELKEKLWLSDGDIYIGNSPLDNPAFKEAAISIGVAEGEKPVDLDCKYWINFEDITGFLNHLYNNNLSFSPEMPGIKAI